MLNSIFVTDVSGIWNKFEDAQQGSKGERHREAAKATADLYSEWRVERLGLEIGEDVNQWSITEWKGVPTSGQS